MKNHLTSAESPFSRSRRGSSVGALAVALCMMACARREDPESKPAPPVVDDVLVEFEAPTLVANEDAAAEFVPLLEASLQLLEDLDVQNEVLDPIFDALEQDEAQEMSALLRSSVVPGAETGVRTKSQAVVAKGDGFMRVTRICDGWADPVVDEEKNGKTVTIVGFSDAGLDPVLWTDLYACRYNTDSGNVLLDAGTEVRGSEVILALGKSVPFDELTETKIVFVLDFRAVIPNLYEENVSLAFRSKPGDSFIEFLVRIDGKSVILFSDGDSLLGFRAQNGIFSCFTEEAQCTDSTGSSISLPF